MKKIVPFFCIIVFFLFSGNLFSQISVVSANGYTVNIVVQPKQIVVNSNSCAYGYNYNVRMDYSVTFEGNNRPSSLYTLQGTLGCGNASHFFDLPNNGGVGTVTSQSNVWNPNTNCGSATTATLGCNVVNIQINGPGISNRTVTFNVSNATLPVELVDFNVAMTAGKVKLTWTTATESNSDFFAIERSADGSNWGTLKTVKAAGNSSSLVHYQAYDESPAPGTNYYRLKQVDIDGKSDYSGVKSLKNTTAAATAITVFPVPNNGNTIHFRGITDPRAIALTILDGSGAAVYTASLQGNSVQLPTLKSGIYVIALNNKVSGEVTNLRYMKM